MIVKVYKKQYTYKIIITPELQPTLNRKAKYMAAAFIKRKPYWYEWPNNFCNLLVLQKIADSEHPWNYFENF
jgi:hypothetical protein